MGGKITELFTSAKKLNHTLGEGEELVKKATDVFNIKSKIFPESGFWSKFWSKIAFWKKKPEKETEQHLIFDTIANFKNIYHNIQDARKKTNKLVHTAEDAQNKAK